jgi:release factor H-coupled RctB family protein
MEPNWIVLDGEGVVIEPAAVDQLVRLARLPGCVRAVGLPDLHPGPGLPIGAAVALDTVRPALVGSDAGCGVRLQVFDRFKTQGDALERRVREATDEPPLRDLDLDDALTRVWRDGPRGLAEVPGVPDELAALAAAEPFDAPLEVPVPDALRMAADTLGTIGGGNHFAELSEVERVVDGPAARRIGLTRGAAVVLVHSGSRGLGALLADRWVELSGDPAPYLAELEGCVRFARTNRLVLGWVLACAAGVGRADRVLGGLDLVHNTVVARDGAWVHRKGAAPAEADALTVVLGSRGAPSWLMCGAGNPSFLCCVAHGAGRRVTRGEAKARIRSRYRKAELTRTSTGTRVVCDDQDLLYEEHPDCYKPIEAVVDVLEARGAARRVAALRPLVTVKR